MKNYEEMAHNVLKRRDAEIKRRKRAFLIGAPCAAAVLVGVIGVGKFAADTINERRLAVNTVVASGSEDDDFMLQVYTTRRDENSSQSNSGGFAAGSNIDAPDSTIAEKTPAYSTERNEIGSAANSDFIGDIEIAPAPEITESAPENSGEIAPAYSNSESVPATTADIAIDLPVDTDPFINDYTNPNSGISEIKVLDIDSIDKIRQTTIVEILEPRDFTPYTFEALDSFYGLRFNRLSELYPNWKLSYDKLGVYRREKNDGFVASLEMYNTCNTLTYTTENGATVEVSAQYEKFLPVSDEMLTADKPIKTQNSPSTEIITEYDENGNVIGMATPSYDPGKVTKPEPDEGVSTVNGYEALIYRYALEGYPETFLADLDMQSRVRIMAQGLSETEFLEVLDNFTK